MEKSPNLSIHTAHTLLQLHHAPMSLVTTKCPTKGVRRLGLLSYLILFGGVHRRKNSHVLPCQPLKEASPSMWETKFQTMHSKGKAITVQAWTGPDGFRRLRLPDFKQSAHEGGKVVSPTHRPPLPRRKYSRHSFLLEAESTARTQCGRKDYVNEKFPWRQWGLNPRPSGL